jgi:hypothetical protein
VTAALRIALIAPNRFSIRQPFAGGLEAHVWHLARAMADEGHRVTLFAEEGSDAAPDHPGPTVRTPSRSAAASRPFPLPGAVFESDHRAYLELMSALAGRRGACSTSSTTTASTRCRSPWPRTWTRRC